MKNNNELTYKQNYKENEENNEKNDNRINNINNINNNISLNNRYNFYIKIGKNSKIDINRESKDTNYEIKLMSPSHQGNG